jgi:hypothetical protein
MGLTVFSAFLSTAVQQLVLIIFALSLAFQTYGIVMLMVVIKGGFSGFLTVPMVLGLVDQVVGMSCGSKAKAGDREIELPSSKQQSKESEMAQAA